MNSSYSYHKTGKWPPFLLHFKTDAFLLKSDFTSCIFKIGLFTLWLVIGLIHFYFPRGRVWSSALWQSKIHVVVNLYEHGWYLGGLHQSWEGWQLDSTPRSINSYASLAHNIWPHKLCTMEASLPCRNETPREDSTRNPRILFMETS